MQRAPAAPSPELSSPCQSEPGSRCSGRLGGGLSSSRKAGEIYGAIVTQSRQPAFYARLGIPDTPTGRYEMVVIHLFLVLERLRGAGASPEAAAAAQALVDAFVADMDDSLRELGTGDVGVPRRVKRAAAGFYARAKDYREAIAAGGSALEANARPSPGSAGRRSRLGRRARRLRPSGDCDLGGRAGRGRARGTPFRFPIRPLR